MHDLATGVVTSIGVVGPGRRTRSSTVSPDHVVGPSHPAGRLNWSLGRVVVAWLSGLVVGRADLVARRFTGVLGLDGTWHAAAAPPLFADK
jgi:hypothetical protein